jgi:peptidoglycan/LPS O-acetylase OafA/YrhL
MTTTNRSAPLHVAMFGLALGLAIPLFAEVSWAPLRRAAHLVARYSYGIYLSHFAIEIFVFSNPFSPAFKHFGGAAIWLGTQQNRPLRMAVFAGLAIVAPVLMYHLIEAPAIQLGRRVTKALFPAAGGARSAASLLPPALEDARATR